MVVTSFPGEINAVALQITEVLLGFCGRGGTETFVVLALPALALVFGKRVFPLFVLRNGVENLRFFTLPKQTTARDPAKEAVQHRTQYNTNNSLDKVISTTLFLP